MLLSFRNCTTTCVDSSSSSSSSSSSVVASNIDLLIQILLCLPVKSLLVFKTVSIQWLSLISDPSFVQNHCIQHRYSIPGLLLLKERYYKCSPRFKFVSVDGNVFDSSLPDPSYFPFKTLNGSERINIIQSCNGLLLFQYLYDSYYFTFETTYYIYNPSTTHYKILPPSPFRKHDYSSNNRLSLAFDPIKSPHYQAICIWLKDGQIEIYSSETDSWRLCGDSVSVVNAEKIISVVNVEKIIFDRSGVYWNGSLHWVNNFTGSFVYFDIDHELMRTLPTPQLPADVTTHPRRFKYFGVYKDHMHLIEIYPHMNNRCDILELKTDYKGWNIKIRLNLNDFIVPLPDRNDFGFTILKFFDEEEEEGESSKLVIQMWRDLNIFSYDLKEMSFKKISSGSSWLHHLCNTHLYIPTLARV